MCVTLDQGEQRAKNLSLITSQLFWALTYQYISFFFEWISNFNILIRYLNSKNVYSAECSMAEHFLLSHVIGCGHLQLHFQKCSFWKCKSQKCKYKKKIFRSLRIVQNIICELGWSDWKKIRSDHDVIGHHFSGKL